MSGDDNKKDLTRIEDLGEFLHDPNQEGVGGLEDFSSSTTVDLEELDSEASSEELPANDIPAGADEEFVIDLSSESTQENTNENSEESIEDLASEPQLDLDTGFESANEVTATEEMTETTQEPFQLDESAEEAATENFMPADDNLSLDLGSEATTTEQFSSDEFSLDDTNNGESSLQAQEQQDFQVSTNEFEETFPTEIETVEQETEEEPAGELLSDTENEIMEQNLQAASSGTASYSVPHFEDDVLDGPDANKAIPEPAPSVSKPRENFEDLRKFGEAITYGEVKAGGNPAYALVIKNIRTKKDKETIFEVLDEHKMTLGEMSEVIKTGLDQGALLLSQLSEYSAIYLAHRLRLLDIDIQFGLSEKMHLSKNYQSGERGLVSQHFIQQNKSVEVDLAKNQFRPQDMITATVPVLPGKKVLHYFNIISAYKNIKLSEFGSKKDGANRSEAEAQRRLGKKANTPWYGPGLEPDEHFDAAGEIDYQEYFDELTEELRIKAFKLGANAVIAISFQLTPLAQATGPTATQYRLVAIGNAVYLVNNEDWEANV
jgi:hypothetical protein